VPETPARSPRSSTGKGHPAQPSGRMGTVANTGGISANPHITGRAGRELSASLERTRQRPAALGSPADRVIAGLCSKKGGCTAEELACHGKVKNAGPRRACVRSLTLWASDLGAQRRCGHGTRAKRSLAVCAAPLLLEAATRQTPAAQRRTPDLSGLPLIGKKPCLSE